MRKPGVVHRARYERMIFSLPRLLAGEVRSFADAVRNGNKSGLVADALRWYLDHVRKARHTGKLRESYAQAAERGRQISQEWQAIDDELWAKLDALKPQKAKGR